MKRGSLIFILFFLFNFVYAVELTKEEKEYIQNKKVIKVHNEKNWPPYNFNEDGKPKGFSIDYTNLITKKLDIKVDYISGYSWNEYMEQLRNGTLDVINNISKNKEREEFISFTKVFHTAANAIYVKSGSEYLDSLEKLEGKTIIMPDGFFAQQFISKHYPKIKQILVKDSLEALRQLSLGKADATIGKKNVLDYIISTNNISGVTPSNFVDDNRMVSLIRMGVPKNETILRDILQKAQDSVTDEELLNLKRKWFGAKNLNSKLNNYLTKEELNYLKSKRFFDICVNDQIKPFEFIDENGEYKGMSADFLNFLQNELNISFRTIKTDSLKQSLEYLSDNKCDLIPSIDNSNVILSDASLSDPLFSYKLAVITKKDEPVVSSIDNIIDKKVAIKEGSLIIKNLKSNYSNIKIVETSSNLESLNEVHKGKAYYTILPLPMASYYMSKFALNDLYISRYTNYSYNIHSAISNSEPKLLSIFNKVINEMANDKKREIENRWISVAVEKKIDIDLIIKIVTMIIIVIGIILYRQSILNKHNNELKKAYKEIAELSSSLEVRVQEEVEKNKQKTSQLIYQARLAQMGELINMIAHQWRQPLTAISATSNNLMLKLMIEKKVEPELLEKELNLVNDYAQHLSGTIEDFRNFYKKDKKKEIISFSEVLDKSLSIIQPSYEQNDILLNKEIVSKKKFESFPTEINQVILNILKNSEDILLDKKVVNPEVTIVTYEKEEHVCLDIKDNGGGIKQKYIKKVFDPYFSTKEQKDGTGLGLYMSKVIIEEHCHGTLTLKNIDNGVCFTICLQKEFNE